MTYPSDLREVVVHGSLAYGIGADGLGEYAECYDTETGRRLASRGPCLDPKLIRKILSEMVEAA